MHFTCGSWILDPADPNARGLQPVQTLVITGFTCRTATIFAGYRQVSTRTLPGSLSPVRATTPDGRPITGKIVVAQYADVLVVAMSDRMTGRANQLMGLRMSDSAELWSYRCEGRDPLGVRFAAVPAGDRPELGHLTVRELAPQVIVACNGRTLRFDPATGPIR